jgi:hypothetical protein
MIERAPVPRRLRAVALTGAVLAGSVVAVVTAERPVSAATMGFSFAPGGTYGSIGTIGIDAVYGGTGGGGAYDARYVWRSDGGLALEQPNFTSPGSVGSLSVGGSPSLVRYELYPKPVAGCGGFDTESCYWTSYDPWQGDVGGIHIQRTAAEGFSVSGVRLPKAGVDGAFRMDGKISSAASVANGRVQVDAFQIECSYPDVCPAPPRTSSGAVMAAFGTSSSRGNKWTGHVGWAGRYLMFIRDLGADGVINTGDDRHAHGFADITADDIPTIDLDAWCFGLDTCVYGLGAPPPAAGSFHPVPPTRILDTRIGTGIANGGVRSGDGRHPSPDPITRRDEAANHTLKVTGRFGVPESGVSAVLLNVTAVLPPASGYVSVYPTPPRSGDVFNDQGSFGPQPTTSNLNVQAGDIVPNMVLARVGAGGTIRLFNWAGPTHVIADLAGWFDSGGNLRTGTGFSGVTPARVLDTRTGVGAIGGRFAVGDDRSLRVVGVGGIPTNASSVVVNITAVGPETSGYVTAYPDGAARPDASNLNLTPAFPVRANLAVVKVGEGGRIRLHTAETGADLIVDVLGSFGSGGGTVEALAPDRIVDSRIGLGTERRPLWPDETRTVQVAGRGGVPPWATAAVVNLTAVDPTVAGYLTLWPAGTPRPTASNVNFIAGQNVPNLAIVRLGSGGGLSVYNELGSTQFIIDVMGYVG